MTKHDSLPELDSCPFCPSPASVVSVIGEPGKVTGYTISCDTCPAELGECSPFKTMREAIIAWNTRATPSFAALDSEEMVEVVAELQANGWEYGTHPKDKAKIVIAAIKEKLHG